MYTNTMQTLTKNNDGEELRIQTKNQKNKGIIKFINTIHLIFIKFK